MKRRKKKKLNIKRTLVVFLLTYILCCSIYFVLKQPIKHIIINGNNYILDSDILRASKLKNYPSIFKYTSKRIEKNIKKLDLIEYVDVKKKLWFTIKITIKENKLLFYYDNKIVLSNGDIVNRDINHVYGIPIFVNSIDKDLLKKFIKGYKKLNDNIIYEINEIFYDPLINEDGSISSKDRYKLIMNDGNTIIVNSRSVSVLNKYNEIFASLGGKLGTINIDSVEINNLVFIPYGE